MIKSGQKALLGAAVICTEAEAKGACLTESLSCQVEVIRS